MPYEIVSAIEKLFILEKNAPREIISLLESQFPNLSKGQLETYVKRFFTLFAQNQWKRERLAPSIHVGKWSLDPKTWFRFPILSGGFKKEI
jgi:NAD+ synthase (glutamine-hydrolysing)